MTFHVSSFRLTTQLETWNLKLETLQSSRREHNQWQHGRPAVANRADEHNVQTREVNGRQNAQQIRPAPANKTPRADSSQKNHRGVRCRECQPEPATLKF